MKTGCSSQEVKTPRMIELPVLINSQEPTNTISKSKTSRWRAGALITLTLLMAAHFIQWRLMGQTVSPIEPSETMYTLQRGAINAGFIFFTLAIVSTMIFGRFVCGWGCHIVALQDFCAWLLKKFGLRPRPFRSRVLVYVPLLAALYMFVWPTVSWALTKPAREPLIPQFSNHLITTDFWATFPPFWVAVPFLFICGFVTVYFLGSKGFCTYACPYGGFFSLADKLSPGKIRVTDACNQCGLCTATCMSNVQVHAEVRQYGMVVDPGCMKHMDCISVCPNDALYFGFGKPSVGISGAIEKSYSLTWPEEIFGAAIFLSSFLAVWDVYLLVPMLMALGIASVTTFLALKVWKLIRSPAQTFYRFNLKTRGRIQHAGWAFLSFAVMWIGLNTHSGYIRYHERAGTSAFERIRIPDELALARTNPRSWLSAADRENVSDGREHLQSAVNGALFVNNDALPKLAWLEYLSGNTERAVEMLATAADVQHGQARALSLYYRGAILNRLGRYDEARASLETALAEANDLIVAREERGESLWQLGRKDDAIQTWLEIPSLSSLPLANNMLAGAAEQMGKTEEAVKYQTVADRATPADPFFHYMVGLRLENLGMNTLAEKHFARAFQLNPQLRARRNLDQMERF